MIYKRKRTIGQISEPTSGDIFKDVKDVNGVRYIAAQVNVKDMNQLRQLADQWKQKNCLMY